MNGFDRAHHKGTLMKRDIKLFLFFLFNITFTHAHDPVDIQNITTSQVLPLHKIECTTDELFNNKSGHKDLLFLPNENESWRNQLPATQLIKDFHLPKTPKINHESFVPSANHFFYDFSKMEATRAPQNIGLNFTASPRGQNAFVPTAVPDTMVGIGPTQIIAVTNMGIVSYDKTTGLRDNIIETTLAGFANFFQFQLERSGLVEVVSPRMRYDQFTDRWFFCCINLNYIRVEGVPIFMPNFLFIAFSDAGIITKTTKWTVFQFSPSEIFPPGGFGSALFSPTFGIDANALYIGAAILRAAPVELTTSLFVFPKAPLINGNPVGTAFRDFLVNIPQGVDNFDPAPTNGFFITNPYGTGVETWINLILFIINNPGTNPTLGGVVPIIVDPFASPLNAPHKGNVRAPDGEIETHDQRFQMAHIRNNQLFTTHHIGVDQTGSSLINDRTALRWYQIDITTPLIPMVIQQGTFFDSALVNPRFFYYPAIMTNARGDLTLSCSTSAADQFIDGMTMGRLALDPPGTLQPPIFLTSSLFSFNFLSEIEGGASQVWGNYSYTALDPSDQMTMWTAQEFCAGTDAFGIQIAQLLAP